MKKAIFALLLTINIISALNGQGIKKTDLYGDWYLIYSKPGIISDTMIFKREMMDSTFNQWRFKRNDTLFISSGYMLDFEQNQNNDKKACLVKASSLYKWSFEFADNIKISSKLSWDNKTDYYSILSLDNESLMMTLEKSVMITRTDDPPESQKIRYYFMQSGYDSAVFKMDTLTLSVKQIDPKFPRIELYHDSLFCFFYHVIWDTIYDKEKGVIMVVEKSDKIRGFGNTREMENSLNLRLNDNTTLHYSVISKEGLRYFIKEK